ncbi:MAG: hypothetical protein KIH62_002860 [Candidatus Kerfeldbacteria bacterium]|nr:hypothetical protein [Candidatus Kerfeldbacteria bacterium]
MAIITGKIQALFLSCIAVHANFYAAHVPTQQRIPTKPSCTFELTLSKREVFLEERVPFKLRLTFDQSAYTLTNIVAPTIDGIMLEPLSAAKKGHQMVDGVSCFVYEWDGILYPQKTGTLVIQGFQVSGEQRSSSMRGMWSVFTSNSIAFCSNSAMLRVHNVPGDTRMQGPVGNFYEVHLEAERTSMRAGEAVLLKYRIKGDGNLHLCKHPEIQLPEGCKWYPAEFKKDQQGSVFEYAVQVMQDGVIVIPSQLFRYFNPDRRAHEELLTGSIRLFVDPAPKSAALPDMNLSRIPGVGDVADEEAKRAMQAPASLIRKLALPDWMFVVSLSLLRCCAVVRLWYEPLGNLWQRLRSRYGRKNVVRHARYAITAAKKSEDISQLYQAFKELQSVVNWDNIQKNDQQAYEAWRFFWQRMEAVKFDTERSLPLGDELLREAHRWVAYVETTI